MEKDMAGWGWVRIGDGAMVMEKGWRDREGDRDEDGDGN